MSLEHSSQISGNRYDSWYHDPEQVENLVLMLEERTVDPKTGKEHWKYGSKHIFRTLFPDETSPWARPYDRAPTPKNDGSFAVTLGHLKKERFKFPDSISPELRQRFFDVVRQRASVRPLEQETWWTNPRKAVVAGLIEYCGLTLQEVSRIAEEKLGERAGGAHALYHVYRGWKKNREYPFEENPRLTLNHPNTIAFVEYLRHLCHMSLQDVRAIIASKALASNRDDTRLDRIEHFIEVYNTYQARWQTQNSTSSSK